MKHGNKLVKTQKKTYLELISLGKATPQEARSILPNSLKTEVIATTNLRVATHFKAPYCKRRSPTNS